MRNADERAMSLRSIMICYQAERDKLLYSGPVSHLSALEYQALKLTEAIEKLLPSL